MNRRRFTLDDLVRVVPLNSVALSPSGQSAAVAESVVVDGEYVSRVAIWAIGDEPNLIRLLPTGAANVCLGDDCVVYTVAGDLIWGPLAGQDAVVVTLEGVVAECALAAGQPAVAIHLRRSVTPRLVPPEGARVHVIDHTVFRSEDGAVLPATLGSIAIVDLVTGEVRDMALAVGSTCEPTELGSMLDLAWSSDDLSLYASVTSGFDADHNIVVAARRLVRLDLATGSAEFLTQAGVNARCPAPSPDGRFVAFVRQRGDGVGSVFAEEIACVDVASGDVVSLTSDSDADFDQVSWTSAGIIAGLSWRGRRKLASITLDGSLGVLTDDHGDGPFVGSSTGAVAYRRTAPDRPQTATLLTGSRQVTIGEPDVRADTISWANTVEFEYRSAHPDGRSIHALAATPANCADPSALPVVVDLHGGPYWFAGFECDPDRELFAAEGYVVVQPNYRGSAGFGAEFMQLSDRRSYPGTDDDPSAPHEMALDVVGVFDWIAAEGFGDPERIFVRGISAGALLATWVLARSDRVRAAVAQSWYAGEWRAASSAWYQYRRYFNSPPWVRAGAAAYWQRSAWSIVGRIETPLLIVQGERDWVTPSQEAEGFYTALRSRGVDVALALFPDEDHGILATPSGRAASRQLELDWFALHGAAARP